MATEQRFFKSYAAETMAEHLFTPPPRTPATSRPEPDQNRATAGPGDIPTNHKQPIKKGNQTVSHDIIENRFYVQLANETDLFISAALLGDEPDFIEKIKARLSARHRGILDHISIVRVIPVV